MSDHHRLSHETPHQRRSAGAVPPPALSPVERCWFHDDDRVSPMRDELRDRGHHGNAVPVLPGSRAHLPGDQLRTLTLVAGAASGRADLRRQGSCGRWRCCHRGARCARRLASLAVVAQPTVLAGQERPSNGAHSWAVPVRHVSAHVRPCRPRGRRGAICCRGRARSLTGANTAGSGRTWSSGVAPRPAPSRFALHSSSPTAETFRRVQDVHACARSSCSVPSTTCP